jgi:hypothetical protein
MLDNGIQAFQPGDGVLSAESYPSFELAKENDDVLGGDNIAQIRSYSAYARAQAQAIHKTIAATNGIEDVAAIKSETTETAQTFAKVSIYADQRIGEILRELPTRQGKRTDTLVTDVTEVTKRQAEQSAGISHKQAIDLQAMAANPDVVQAVLDKAEAEGRIPSRKQVLDAIHDRKIAEMERDNANDALAEAYRTSELMEAQIASLQKQVNDKPKPEIVEREVESKAARKRISELEHERDLYLDNVQKLRKRNEDMRSELDKAKDMLGMDKTLQDVRKDVQYLTSATNQYVRQYGGLTWTAASLEQVDAQSLAELRTAAINLATFANALVASLENFNG